jgi:hypothetical protein
MSITTNEHPILFGGPMIRSILEGRKTQTRRVINPQPDGVTTRSNEPWIKRFITRVDDTVQPPRLIETDKTKDGQQICKRLECPYGVPGDRLIVRESWRYYDWTEDGEPQIQYQADGELRWIDLSDVPEETIEKIHNHWAALSEDENFAREGAARDTTWRPSIHMFHCFSRITLEVKRVWVERVQEISEADARAEGCNPSSDYDAAIRRGELPAFGATDGFRELWDSINADRGHGWDTNPWVWCVEFERVEGER